MGNLPRFVLLLLGLFLIVISLTSWFDISSRGEHTFASPTPFTYLVTASETPPVFVTETPNPATATVGAAFTQIAASTSTILPTSTALTFSPLTTTPVFASATSTPTVPPASRILGKHIVRPGEYLYCIGRAYGVIPEEIAFANSLHKDTPLTIGQILLIPDIRWVNIPPGRICVAQFQSPYAPIPSLTPTRRLGMIPDAHDHKTDGISLINFIGSNEMLNQLRSQTDFLEESLTPEPVAEFRTVYVDWPIEMHLGESNIVIMTFNAGTGQITVSTSPPPVNPTPESMNTPDPDRDTDSSDRIDIPDVGDRYRIFAIARLDAAGFDYSPREDVQKEIKARENQKLEWRWSIQPRSAQTQELIINLRLHYEPKVNEDPRPDEDVWTESYLVKVKKNFFEIWFGTQAPVVLAATLLTGIASLISVLISLWQKIWPAKGPSNTG